MQSKKFLLSLNNINFGPKDSRNSALEAEPAASTPIINGVPYFQNEHVYDRQVEVLADCVAIRGDHFYLKKGELVVVKSVISEYAYVVYRGFKGYFPSCFLGIDTKNIDN